MAAGDRRALAALGVGPEIRVGEVQDLDTSKAALSLVWHEPTHHSPDRIWLRTLLSEVAAEIIHNWPSMRLEERGDPPELFGRSIFVKLTCEKDVTRAKKGAFRSANTSVMSGEPNETAKNYPQQNFADLKRLLSHDQ